VAGASMPETGETGTRIGGLPGFSAVGHGVLIGWYALSAAAVYALPSMLRLGTPWTRPAAEEVQAWYWLLAFAVAAFGVILARITRGRVTFPVLLALGTVPWLIAFAALMFRDQVSHSRGIALLSIALGDAFLVAPVLFPDPSLSRRARIITWTTAAVAALSTVLLVTFAARRPVAREPISDRLANTARLPVHVRYATGLVRDSVVVGGALVSLGSNLLLVTGSGTWHEINWDTNGRPRATRVSLPPPMSRELPGVRPRQPRPMMRVVGLAAARSADSLTIYVAHEVWRPNPGCVVLQVSVTRVKDLAAADGSQWKPLYATQPCLTPGVGFSDNQQGGRLLLLTDGSLIFGVGDYGQIRPAPGAPQDPSVDFGKTLRIGLDGSRTLFTTGHRNPGGIALDSGGNVWGVDHGPRGGDEVNLLQAGGNYGWPLTTYGSDYGAFEWAIATPADAGSRFTDPSYALVPSLGISSLIVVRGKEFAPWDGDLLAGSLAGQRLLRFKTAGRRIVYAEPIAIDRRVRDLAQTSDGRIVLWTDTGDLVWLMPAPELLEQAAAFAPCSQCHALPGEGPRLTEPSLQGIVGRKVASLPGFEYSDALKRVGGRWDEQRLDAFLRSPSEFAPGTIMSFPGIADSARRHALVTMLQREFSRK
jgi:cytochrome c2